MALVVDVGWAYWRQEACSTAAQSAAVAAALVAEGNAGNGCGNGSNQVPAQQSTACPATLTGTNPIGAGCLYAKQNGFVNGRSRQTVSMASGCTASPVTGVSPSYWVTATVSERIPALFSSILGNSFSTVSAHSTSGVFISGGCVYALEPTNVDITMSNGSLSSNCGIYLDSNNVKAINASNGHISTTGGAKTQIYTGGQCNRLQRGCSVVNGAGRAMGGILDCIVCVPGVRVRG
jgi:hypothetical protein